MSAKTPKDPSGPASAAHADTRSRPAEARPGATNRDAGRDSPSGAYRPGPVNETGMPTSELAIVQANRNDLALEEFTEGPYGAATDAPRLGKTSPWRPGQMYSPRFRDANPIDSDRTVPLQEPPADAREGTIEAEN